MHDVEICIPKSADISLLSSICNRCILILFKELGSHKFKIFTPLMNLLIWLYVTSKVVSGWLKDRRFEASIRKVESSKLSERIIFNAESLLFSKSNNNSLKSLIRKLHDFSKIVKGFLFLLRTLNKAEHTFWWTIFELKSRNKFLELSMNDPNISQTSSEMELIDKSSSIKVEWSPRRNRFKNSVLALFAEL